jgi:exodeoxyribonuclease VII large subunit
VSYRAALERGFALVRGSDGHVRRRAATIGSGEKLTISFADGEVNALATDGDTAGTKPSKPRKGKDDQGTLL